MLLYHYLAITILAILATVSVAENERPLECTRLMNFNTFLTPVFDNYTTRRIDIPRQLSEQIADVYCLQGYWQECDIEVLLSEVNCSLPYHFSAIHSSVGVLQEGTSESLPTCLQAEGEYFSNEVLTCARENGCKVEYKEHEEAEAINCLFRACATEIRNDNITTDCLACIIRYARPSYMQGISQTITMEHLKGHRPSTIYIFMRGCFIPIENVPRYRTCTPNTESCNKRFNPPGLVLLSKYPMTTARYVSYFPGRAMAYPTGYLEAEVEDFGTVVCAILAIPGGIYREYDLQFGNFSNQRFAEIDTLVQNFKDQNHLLMGSLWTGPESPEMNVSALSPDHYNRLVSAGYRNPLPNACTICSKEPGGYSVQIEHIFINGEAYTARQVEQVLDTSEPYTTHDVYSVQVDVCPVQV